MNVKTLLFFSLCFGLLSSTVFGQYGEYYRTKDSIDVSKRVNYTEDVPTKQLTKAGLALPVLRQSSFRGFYQTVAFNVLVERKIRNFSFLFGLQSDFGFASDARLFQLELPLDLRYYFSIGRRTKQQINSHSLYRYYVGIHTQNIVHSRLKYARTPNFGSDIDRYERGQILPRAVNNGLIHESFNFLQYAHLQVGRQWKLFDQCFVDANAVVPIASLVYHKWDYTLSSPAFATITFGYRLGER